MRETSVTNELRDAIACWRCPRCNARYLTGPGNCAQPHEATELVRDSAPLQPSAEDWRTRELMRALGVTKGAVLSSGIQPPSNDAVLVCAALLVLAEQWRR